MNKDERRTIDEKHFEQMKAEFGKYYLLKPDKLYFSVDLQRQVKFPEPLVVKCDSGFFTSAHFGYLVDIDTNSLLNEHVTNNEIEFVDDDIINEYQLKTK